MDIKLLSKVLMALVLLAGVGCLTTKDEIKNKLVKAFLALCTIMVVCVFSATAMLRDKESKASAMMEAGQAEFLLRLEAATKALTESMPMGKLAGKSDKLDNQAAKTMAKAVDHDPSSLAFLFRNVVLLAEIGEHSSFETALGKVSRIKDARAEASHKLLSSLYEHKSLAAGDVTPSLKLAEELTDPGFFRDTVRLEIYKAAGEAYSKQYSTDRDAHIEAMRNYGARVLGFMVVICGLVLLGLLTLFVSLFFLPRKITSDVELAEIRAPANYGFLKVYGVFIGWLALECVLSPVMVQVMKPLKAAGTTPVMMGLLTMGIYLFNNLPALFLAWWFAIKPAGFKFGEAVKFRFKTPKHGIFALVFLGVSTWLTAIPVILGYSLMAKDIFKLEGGSSNPILNVVLQSTHGHDQLLTTFVFIIAIGVLPALCEETLFRGFLYTSLRCRLGAFLSMVISAFIFAAVHMDIGAFGQLFSLGFLFALIFERTRSLIPSMVAHCMWNSGTFILMMVLFGS